MVRNANEPDGGRRAFFNRVESTDDAFNVISEAHNADCLLSISAIPLRLSARKLATLCFDYYPEVHEQLYSGMTSSKGFDAAEHCRIVNYL